MSMTLLSPDRQETWAPMWVLESVALPERYYATRDCAVPVTVGGDPFVVGDSEAGSEDLVGGGAGSGDRPAHGAILGDVVITRKLVDVLGGQLVVQDVEIMLANGDGRLLGDYRSAPVLLWRYDAVSRLVVSTTPFVISHGGPGERLTYKLTLTTFDRAILEEIIPKGTITLADFPFAVSDAIGKTPAWVFGNVVNLPLPNVRDDQITSQFDYLLCRDDAAALTGVRRVIPGGANPFIEMDFAELEPYPGMDGYLVNGRQESWDSGVAVAPDGWALVGAGGTIAKEIVIVDEGSASAKITRVGTNLIYVQALEANAPELPASYWQLREMTLTARVWSNTPTASVVARIDDVGSTSSTPHTGGAGWETLAVTRITNTAATFAHIAVLVSTVNCTVYVDDVRVYLRAKSWNECLRPDLYPGYTALRTYLRQEDSSGSLFQLVADVNGGQPERNPVRAIRTFLSDATHGLGKAVDAVSFDAAEAAICLTYEDVLNLDGPELFSPFRDVFDAALGQTFVIKDRSGHERHGLYDKAAAFIHNFNSGSGISPSGDPNDACLRTQGDGDWIAYPDSLAYSTQTPTVRLTVQFPSLTASATDRPLVEKLIGVGTLSGYGFYRKSNTDVTFFVRGADTVLYSVSIVLNPGTDEDVWMDLHGEAEGGVLRIYRNGVLAATGSYTGAIAEGSGEVLVAKFGTGGAGGAAIDRFDNIALYRHACAVARIAAHTAAIPLQVEVIATYDVAITGRSPTFYYELTEDAGSLTMTATVGGGGSWIGTPALGVAPGVLNRARGFINSGSAARFQNNVSKYGVVTGMTLNNASATFIGWYRPTTLQANAGLNEKTIGGVRGTQFGFCQRIGSGTGGVVRFTIVAAGGTVTLDVPLLAEDVGRATLLAATWTGGAIEVYKNGVLAVSGTYTGALTSGVGDFYIGCQGTNGGPRTRPAQGDLGRWSYHPSHFTADDMAALWLAATWYPGGLCVDAALREPRQAQDWLAQLCLMRGMRLGVTSTGAWTITVDQPATVLRCEARDGIGAGERTLLAITDRQRTPLETAVSTVAIEGRVDLLTGAPLVTRTRSVDVNRGKPRTLRFDVAREYPTLDRIAGYLQARLALDEAVTVRLTQEARYLSEGELVRVTDAEKGYTGQDLQAASIGLGLEDVAATLREYDATRIFTWTPEAFPAGAGPG